MEKIEGLTPAKLWYNFKSLCDIPRPSKHEEEVVKWMKEFGERLSLSTIVDQAGNVVIRKPAFPGMENRKGVILQSHLDMVPQKNNDVKHDFTRDPILPLIDGEWVKADNTTLGADNGIGVASIMALLESDNIKHGPIEALFTVDEETGMTGAFALEEGLLKGQILLNLDSEEEGELYVGCAGGVDANIDIHYMEDPVPSGFVPYKINITGLKGGHSGLDIHLGRANAIKLLTRFLWKASKDYGIRLGEITGGSLRNAIPREAMAIMLVDQKNEADFIDFIEVFKQRIMNEYAGVEDTCNITVTSCEMPFTVVDETAQHHLLNALYACPNGVIRMSDSFQGVVETSTNLALVEMKSGIIKAQCLIRSLIDSAKHDVANMMDSVFTLADADINFDGEYPGWKPAQDSDILNIMKKTSIDVFGHDASVKVIHAGLECGIIGGKYPGLDMISFGPTIRFPHSPDEKVHIGSVQKFWNLLIKTLEEIPEA